MAQRHISHYQACKLFYTNYDYSPNFFTMRNRRKPKKGSVSFLNRQKTWNPMNDEFLKKLMNENCFSDILGQKEAKKQLRSALMMKRNVIIVGAPGIGK